MSKIRPSNLAAQLTVDLLCQRAGSQSFSRGQAYFYEGRVHALSEDEMTITAKVAGT